VCVGDKTTYRILVGNILNDQEEMAFIFVISVIFNDGLIN
jgi:hypothetical protein